jgi:hypothetical protein
MKYVLSLILVFLLSGAGASTVNAQDAKNSHLKGGAVMAQKWEYKILYRNRSLDK